MLRYCDEKFAYVGPCESRCLYMIIKIKVFHEFKAVRLCHFSFLRVAKVRPVSDQVANYITFRVILNLLLPSPDVFEWVWVCDIVDKYHSMTSFVKYSCYVSERLLPSCVPYLELYEMFLVDAHQIVAKLNPNSYVMLFVEFAFHETHQDRWLANTWVPDYYHFEKAIVIDFLLVVNRDEFVK